MTKKQNAAIQEFYKAVKTLRDLNVIRSDKYLGDIAEYLCCRWFGMTLEKNQRQEGHDGKIGKTRVQVKYSGGKSTTVSCGNPNKYDELIIVLGKDSKLRSKDDKDDYVVYRISSAKVKKQAKYENGSRQYSKNQLPAECKVSVG